MCFTTDVPPPLLGKKSVVQGLIFLGLFDLTGRTKFWYLGFGDPGIAIVAGSTLLLRPATNGL